MGKDGVRLVPGDEGYVRLTDPSVEKGAEVKMRRPEYNEAVICRHKGCVFHVPPAHCAKLPEVMFRFVVDEDGITTARCQSREEEQKGAILHYRARPERTGKGEE